MGIVERRQREKEQRRSAIIDAAEAVFFSKGLEIATMDDVAEEAELSKRKLLDKNISNSGFKTLDEIVEYSFALTRQSLEHDKMSCES